MSLGRWSLLALIGLALGCGGGASSSFPMGPPCSVEAVTGSIAGVTLAIRASKCVFGAGEPAVFTYEVLTDPTVPPIQIMASMGCGSCRRVSTSPLSFVSWTIGGVSRAGTPQQYCLCDTGCCAPDVAQTVRVDATRASAMISWSGHTWQGPSDTGQREGAAFEPGNYQVTVTFSGGSAGSTTARLPIEVR